MTEREKQIYKSGRKNPNGYKNTPFIFTIKYNKKILAITILIFLICIAINFIIGFNLVPKSDFYVKLGIIDGIEKQDSDFAVYFLDVGQSDCSIVVCDDKVMMIDTGTKSRNIKIRAALLALEIDKIDYLIVTHPHDDHMGNAADIIKRYNVENIIMPKIATDNQVNTLTFNHLINSIAKYEVNPMTVNFGDRISIGCAKIDFLAPFEQNDNLNNMSIVLKVSFGDTSFLFQGDAEDTIEKKLLSSDTDISADVIKVGHHGSNTSTGDEYLDRVNPSIAVVSCGADNTYKHPNKQTIDILENEDIKTYITAYDGNIVITSDGKSINVICENKNA